MGKRSETQAVFDRKLKQWIAHWKPLNPVEREMVRRIAEHDWLLHRAHDAHKQSLIDSGGAPLPGLAQLLKFQAIQERAFHDSTSILQELRDFERLEADGFVSQNGTKGKKNSAHQGNPWLNADLDPMTECGWADPITGKFTPFGDGFAAELAEEQALAETDRNKEADREKNPAA